MCECGIIPVMRRLLRKGVPLSVCICYMLAGPIINVVVITSTVMAFSQDTSLGAPYWFPVLRVGLGYVVAFLTALVVVACWIARPVTDDDRPDLVEEIAIL